MHGCSRTSCSRSLSLCGERVSYMRWMNLWYKIAFIIGSASACVCARLQKPFEPSICFRMDWLNRVVFMHLFLSDCCSSLKCSLFLIFPHRLCSFQFICIPRRFVSSRPSISQPFSTSQPVHPPHRCLPTAWQRRTTLEKVLIVFYISTSIVLAALLTLYFVLFNPSLGKRRSQATKNHKRQIIMSDCTMEHWVRLFWFEHTDTVRARQESSANQFNLCTIHSNVSDNEQNFFLFHWKKNVCFFFIERKMFVFISLRKKNCSCWVLLGEFKSWLLPLAPSLCSLCVSVCSSRKQ